jgi:hypothetical protein
MREGLRGGRRFETGLEHLVSDSFAFSTVVFVFVDFFCWIQLPRGGGRVGEHQRLHVLWCRRGRGRVGG